MKASEMTFGIEIECFLPRTVIQENGIVIGGYHRGIPIPSLPAGWKAESDCSLRTSKRGYQAIEIVSPILQGTEGIEQVIAVVAQLKEWGFHTNASCGLHIHVGAKLKQNPKVLRNLINLTAKFERALFALTGTKRREHNQYAGVMSSVYEAIKDFTKLEQFRPHANKYRSLNISPLWTSKQTVEFRVFQGTTQITKILGYIQVVLGLVENAYAIRRKPTYRCSNYRHQTGRGLWYRMARNFNWYSEKRMGDTQYGLLTPERLDAIKKEFNRLAKKYDNDTSYQQRLELQPVVSPRR